MRVLFVRHGQTPSNVRRAVDTALPGPGLTDLGLEQADALVGALADPGLSAHPPAAVYASPARRAQQTAEPVARSLGLPVRVLDGLQEIQAGDLEMAVEMADIEVYLRTVGAWVQGDLDARMPGAETGEEVFARVDAALQQVVDEQDGTGSDATVLVVSHGALIRAWTTVRARNLAPGFLRHNALGNTGVVVLDSTDEGWVCRQWSGAALGGPGVDDADPWDGPAGAPLAVADG